MEGNLSGGKEIDREGVYENGIAEDGERTVGCLVCESGWEMNRIAKSKGDVGEKAFLSWVGELRVKHAMAIKVEKRQVPMVRIWSAGSPAGKDVWVPAAKSGADFFGSSGGQHFEVEVKTTRQPRLNLRDAFSSRKKDRTTGKSAVSEPTFLWYGLSSWRRTTVPQESRRYRNRTGS